MEPQSKLLERVMLPLLLPKFAHKGMSGFVRKQKQEEVFPSTISRKRDSAGFTIIELLVVIAIIALLAAIMIVSLGDNKDRAKDATIKSILSELAKAAEISYSENTSYDGVCHVSDNTLADTGDFTRIEISLANQSGTNTCRDSVDGYAVISTMNNEDCWCVDWQGSSKEIVLSGGDSCADVLVATICP